MTDGAKLLRAALQELRRAPDQGPAAAATEFALHLAESGSAGFGYLLRQARERANLSVARLAKVAQLSEGTIKNLEAGRSEPAGETMARLISVAELGLGAHAALEPGPNSWLLPHYNRRQLLQDMELLLNSGGGALEQTMLYLDDSSASDWLALSKSTIFAGSFRALPVSAIAERMLQDSSGPLDVNALGAGDGRTEVQLCVDLLGHCPDIDLRLHLLDISHPLLHAAFEHAQAVLGDRVAISTLHGNFHYLSRFAVLLPKSGPSRQRIYSLVGHTLSNLENEVYWIRDQLGLAAPGDYMIADYQIAYAPPEQPQKIRELDPPLSQGVPPSHLDWVTGPIRRYARELVDVKVALELNPYCPMPGSYELATYATVRRRDGSEQRYLLTRVRRYTTEKLRDCLEDLGWKWVEHLPYGPTGRAAVALLRRAG
jgi:transcriptional regulator with XRE-family HTH domain